MSMAIIAGVVGAGATIYGASQSGGGSAPAPAQLNPRQSILSYIRGVSGGMPLLYGTESNWRPQFGELNIGDQTQYLNALLGLGGNAAGAAGDQIETERDRELANMRGNVGSANAILDAINPQGRQRVNEANQMASDAFTRSQGPLSWQESRGANQQAREAFGARGRVGDNAAVASEILGREEVMAGKRAEATQLGNNAAALAGQFTSPVMGLLQGIPAGVSLGQDYLNQSQRIIGQNTPQLINPDAGINMGMAQASALNSYNMSRAAAQQNQGAMWGNLGSSLMGLAGDLYNRPNTTR